jgi:hypothetical protein
MTFDVQKVLFDMQKSAVESHKKPALHGWALV